MQESGDQFSCPRCHAIDSGQGKAERSQRRPQPKRKPVDGSVQADTGREGAAPEAQERVSYCRHGLAYHPGCTP